MTRPLYRHIGIKNMFLTAALCICLAETPLYAATVTIAVTQGTLDVIGAIARAFEVQTGDNVQIVVISSPELKGSVKSLPLHLIVSDDAALIAWMEARNIAIRPSGKLALSVPLVVVTPLLDADNSNTTGDLINRMKQQDSVLTISDPSKTDCGRRARSLLNSLGINSQPSGRLSYSGHTDEVISRVRNKKAQLGLACASEAMNADGVHVHGLSAPTVSAPIHIFVVKQGQQNHSAVQRLLAFANSSVGRDAIKTNGFEPLIDLEVAATPS